MTKLHINKANFIESAVFVSSLYSLPVEDLHLELFLSALNLALCTWRP